MMPKRGYTLIELVLVMFLLILVAAGVFTLAASGSEAFLRLSDSQRQTADLRTGLSYVDVQVRKHDSQGALSIRGNPFGGQPALVIEQVIDGRNFLTWIYVHQGYLCELFVESGIAVTADMASRIVPMDGMDVDKTAPGALRVTLRRQTAGSPPRTASRLIGLRAAGGKP